MEKQKKISQSLTEPIKTELELNKNKAKPIEIHKTTKAKQRPGVSHFQRMFEQPQWGLFNMRF